MNHKRTIKKNTILRTVYILMFIFFIQFGLSADSTKVLIIGSTHDLGDKYGSDSAAFSPTDIANKLKKILSQNGPGNATVTVEERYSGPYPSGFVYGSATFQSKCYNLTGWFHYPLPAGAEEARWANLRGESGTVWDYVVIIGDPYTMEKTPGMYAQGVAKVAEEVAKGADPAEVILLMNWPASASSSTVDHYKEVVYRTGRSGGYKVAPAALAWQAAGSPSGASHPNADGAYIAAASIYSRIYNQSASNSGYNYNDSLADTVQTTVETNVGQPQYSGDFNFINPYLMLGDKRRDVHFSENGTSTEEDFKNAAKSAMDRSRVTYNTSDYCPNGSSSSASYNSNTPEDDGLGWPVGNEMPIAWNHGRTYPDGRIKLNPDYWQLGLGYEYQWNTSSYSDEIANDHYIAMMDYYDTNRANDRLADAAIGARWMPTRMLWAQMHKEYPALDPMRDSNHLNWDQTHAVGTYMYTLYSGRCPLDPEPSPMTSRWMAQKIGYETAWRMGRCQTRAPGFKVMPSAASAKTVTPTSSDTMPVQFIMAPTHDVTVNISTSDALKGKVSPSQLTFTPANYNVPQTVTVIGETGVAGSFEFDAQFSTTSTDPVYDGLSDAWTYTNTRTQGLSQILGNDVVIETGDTTPDLADDTDFGYVDASLTKVFTIFNQSATDTVNLTDSPRVTLSDESGNFTLSQDTASSAIAPLGSTNFSITYDATADLSGGLHTAAVSISSSDPLLPTYTFTVQALSPGQPAVINVGVTGGQLSATLEGQLSAGTRADAIIYWGTTDGGATPGNWENSQSFTAVNEGNNFSAELTGLVAGRQYYYRVFASNSKGEAWSESTALFMTAAPAVLAKTPVRWGAPIKYWSIDELSPALWLDASDASTITQSGGAVSQWADKSGNNRDATQTDGALKPTYTLSSMNGQDVLTFDGSDDHLDVDLDFLAGVSHSAFIVTNVTDYGIIYGARNGFSGAQSLHVGFRDSDYYMMNYWANDYDQGMSANFNAGQANLVNYVWTSGSDKQVFANGFFEGNSGSAGVVDTMAGGGMIGGGVVEVGNYFGGDIAEMIILTGDVEAETRQKIEGYLAHKWGQTSSLPVDHPYKSIDPRLEIVSNALDLNPAFWLDASDASTITESGGAVSQWADKSGKNNHAYQGTAERQPTLNGDQINFDGGDILSVTNDAFKELQNPCVVVLGKWDSSSSWGNAFAAYHGESGVGWQLRQRSGDVSKLTLTVRGTAGAGDPDPSVTTNTSFFIGSAYRNNASIRTLRHNGTQTYADTGDTGTITYSGSERSSIGGRYHGDAFSDPGGFLNGSIKEIIVLDNATDEDVQQIEGYLAWKWGLESNLPVDHPYANEPPASEEHMVTADVSMSVADSYNASTPTSPDLGVNDYYLTDINNRTPVFYGAHQAGLTIKSDATQGYAELAEEMMTGDRTKAMMIWKKADFLADRGVTLTRFKLDLSGPADLSYENRWVVEKDDQFYISDQTFSTGNQDVDVSTLTWSEYTPLNGGSDTIGTAATISLHDLDSIGFYVNAERTANSGDSWMRTSVYYFAVDGDEDPDLSATVNYVNYVAGTNGSITGTATQEVIYDGSTTAVTATPEAGYEFVNWSDGSTANPRSDTNVTSSQSYTANFAPVTLNQDPTANAGADQTVEDADNSGSENVTLDASASIDSDGTIASYVWTENAVQIATGVSPAVDFTIGTHTITLTVTDDDGATATDTVVVTVNEPVVIEQPTITDAEDEIYVNGETVTVSGANFNTDSKVYISADATLDESAVLQSEMVIADGASLTFTVNRGTISEGNMYLFVTNDADIAGGADAALTSDATPIQVGHLWTPADITTTAWFDASDASTITESVGAVSQWNDKSGKGNNATQDIAANQATLNGTQLDFDGNDIFKITNDPFNALENPTIVILGNMISSSSWSNAFVSYHGESGIGWQVRQRQNSIDKLTFTVRGTDGIEDPDPSTTTNTSFFIGSTYRKDSNTRILKHNGTQTYIDTGDTGTIAYAGYNRSAIGGRYHADNFASPAGHLNGGIKEVIVLDNATDEDVAKLEGYIAHKWGIQANLPEGHPYKSGVAIAYGLIPTANAGTNQTLVDTDSSGSESVNLDASASSDSDGTITSYVWTQNAVQIATGINPTVDLAVGTHNITLIVTDNDGTTATDTVVITVNGSITLRDPENPANVVNGINWERYLGTWDMLPDFDALTVNTTGMANTIQLGLGEPTYDYGYRFTGYLDVPTDGEYTFYTASDDGSKLYIGETEVVSNDGLHGVIEKSGKIGLKAGKHAITVTFFQKGGGHNLAASYEGPGVSKQSIPAASLFAFREPENPANVVNGINWERYLGTWDMLPDFDALTTDATGTASTIQLGLGEPTYDYGYRFTGYVNVLTDGVYTFYTASDDGSKLYIGETEVVSNDGLHGVVEKSGTIALKAGKHAITVTFFQKGGGHNLAASYKGPGVTKQSIPAASLFCSPETYQANLAPVANNSSVTTNKDAAVAITLEAHDPEGYFLVYTITTWPSNGTFVQNGGEGTYTPYAGYTGPDSFTFTVNDGEFTSGQATVSIEVLGNAPVIDTAASATPDTIYEFDSTALTVSASDPDGDLLTYAWSIVSGPGIATFDAPTSDFTLVSFSAVGSYVLRVTVSDGNQAVTSDVTVTVQ